MRLIDAEELVITILTNDLCGDDNVDKAILNAPTVKAIPIEWIEKYYTHITSPYTDTRIQFEEMIRKWEEENE